MRRALTATDIALLETHPQSSRLYLVVDKPTVLFQATVNKAITTGMQIINYDPALTVWDMATLNGSWENITGGSQIVNVGTSAGGTQVGTIAAGLKGNIFSGLSTGLPFVQCSPSQIYVETNSLVWAAGQYLTIPGTAFYSSKNAWARRVSYITYGAMIIPYDNASGDYTKIKDGMTLLVGTTAGGSDLGRVRIRGATSTLLLVAMNGDVNWGDPTTGLPTVYLTVVESVDLWAKLARMHPVTGVWYKDEQTLTSGNDSKVETVWLPPVPIMGPPRIGFLDGGHVDLNFIGDKSYTLCSNGIVIGSTAQGDVSCVAGAGWTFPDGTIQSGSAAALGTEAIPNVVRWTTAGRRLVSLDVKNDKPASYEKHTVGYRPVFILNRPESGLKDNVPYEDFEVKSLSGDFVSGGWTGTIRVWGDADEAEFPDQAMVVIAIETTYGATQQNVGGYPGAENVLAVLWIMSETTHVDFDQVTGERYVEFQVTTIDGVMKELTGDSTYWEDRTTVTSVIYTWWTMFKIQVDRAALAFAAFHTTLLNMCDLQIVGNNRRMWVADLGEGCLYRQLDDYTARQTLGRLLCSRQSTLHLEYDIQTAPGDGSTDVVVMALDRAKHLREALELPRPHRKKIRRLTLEGLMWNGQTSTPVLGSAPAGAPGQEGVNQYLSGFVFDQHAADSAQLVANTQAAKMFASLNNPWTNLPVKFQGAFSVLDIAPQAWLTFSLAASENKRGVVWSAKKFVPRSVTLNYDGRKRSLLVDASLDAQAGQASGVGGNYVAPAPVGYDSPSVTPPPPPVVLAGWNNVAYAATIDGLYKVVAGVKDWYCITPKAAPFDPALALNVTRVAIDPAVVTAGVQTDVVILTDQGVFRGHLDLATTTYSWSKWTLPSPPNSWSDSPAPTAATCTFKCLEADYVNAGTFYLGVEFNFSSNLHHCWLLKVVDSGGTQTYTWMPLATDYPSPLASYVDRIDSLKVDTENGTRIYLTHSWGYLVLSSAMNSLIRHKESGGGYAFGQFFVTVPWYRSGGARNGNHVIFWGDISVSSTQRSGVYSTDGGATLSLLNTGTHNLTSKPLSAVVCDGIGESTYRVYAGYKPMGGNGYAFLLDFSTWGNDWETTTPTIVASVPGLSSYACAQQVRKKEIVLLDTYFTNAVVLSMNGGGSWLNMNAGLPGGDAGGVLNALVVDWGK